ncbi:CDP-alcohol phosphatidyltransferase [Erythrobacter sp. SG61-1L]|uniref:CDP-alcohol phosphatidyltransferase family protein n=1 Tax=Erythrobacter sp. SG61-1L TaxID=1603897 RepID=UPI0006C90579|nr:CDP-alcohol phosphatidyltransferase family protein [Erythrobacter sp. SG61-1L]KPL67076.1 CDP-alcohol phosphatidyltransferase [Erythrobacter sp. SG61-1L]
MTTGQKAHQPVARIQQNVLAVSERRLLNWICARLPAWVTPDLLTGTGVAGAVAIFAGYALSTFSVYWLWLAIAGYVIQWFGDSLDGSLARFRKIERPHFGYFIDHSCDGLTLLLILAGIGLSPYVSFNVAMVTLAGYLLLSIHAFLATHVLGEMRLSYLAMGPTELRFVLIGTTFVMMIMGYDRDWFADVSGFDLTFGGAGALMILIFVVQTLKTAKQLAAEERR